MTTIAHSVKYLIDYKMHFYRLKCSQAKQISHVNELFIDDFYKFYYYHEC